MSQFNIHSIQSAPAGAQALLQGSLKKYGFIPNLHGGLAEAPVALEAYIELTALFDRSSLSPTERQVVLLAVSAENHCTYCVAAHSTIAKHMVKADPAVVDAIRNLQPLPDPKLDALANFTRNVVKNRGVVRGPNCLKLKVTQAFGKKGSLPHIVCNRIKADYHHGKTRTTSLFTSHPKTLSTKR